MNQPAPTHPIAALHSEEARVIRFDVDPQVILDPLQVPGYSEDLTCREREDLLDEAEWALENEAGNEAGDIGYKSGLFGACAELGAGKSFFLKRQAGDDIGPAEAASEMSRRSLPDTEVPTIAEEQIRLINATYELMQERYAQGPLSTDGAQLMHDKPTPF